MAPYRDPIGPGAGQVLRMGLAWAKTAPKYAFFMGENTFSYSRTLKSKTEGNLSLFWTMRDNTSHFPVTTRRVMGSLQLDPVTPDPL